LNRWIINEITQGQRQGKEVIPTTHAFKVGDHVEWNSEAGRVRGTIKKKITSQITFNGYTVHASKEEPQYLIDSDKTDHQAMHKGSALTNIGKSTTDPKKGGRAKCSRPKPKPCAKRFFLEPVPPFRLDLTAWTLRRRPDNAIDRWDGATYCRVLTLADGSVEVAIAQMGPPETPRLRVMGLRCAPS
jgi:hypothetical protein